MFHFLKIMLDIFQEIRKNSGYHIKIILSMLKGNVVANIMALFVSTKYGQNL